MAITTLGLPPDVQQYLLDVGVRETDLLRRLREETAAMPEADMQVAPEEGAFLHLLAAMLGARRCLEVGTFTGYSSIAVASALPPDGRLICCDVSEEWTTIARRYWAEAGLTDRIDLRLGPAIETLDALLAEGAASAFDLAFIDADKTGYADYYERVLRLLRPGGVVALDNVLRGGRAAGREAGSPSDVAIRALNARLATDERVDLCMLPLADGVTLARRR